MAKDWKTYALFCSEGGESCKLATRELFIGQQAALLYAEKHLAYLHDAGGWFAIIPLAETKKALPKQ